MEAVEEESNRWAELIVQFKLPLLIITGGILLSLVGIRLLLYSQKTGEIVFIENSEATSSAHITVHVAGAVRKPGLYTLPVDSRIQDAVTAAGGLTDEADSGWIEREVNLAQKLVDGTKIYMPNVEDTPITQENTGQVAGENVSNAKLNINTASSSLLDSLPGVGEVTAQKIINNRPYTSLEELLTKKVVNKSVFEKIKDQISLY